MLKYNKSKHQTIHTLLAVNHRGRGFPMASSPPILKSKNPLNPCLQIFRFLFAYTWARRNLDTSYTNHLVSLLTSKTGKSNFLLQVIQFPSLDVMGIFPRLTPNPAFPIHTRHNTSLYIFPFLCSLLCQHASTFPELPGYGLD